MRSGASPHVRRFYMFGAAGLTFLAADEIFGLHETLGHNLQFLPMSRGRETGRSDLLPLRDSRRHLRLVLRDVLLAHRNAVRFFAVGIFFAAVAAVGDLSGSGVDELAEVITAFCLFAALVSMTVTTLRQELELDRTAASPFDRFAQPADGSRTRVAPDLPVPAQPSP
jgi:hypothetical protein